MEPITQRVGELLFTRYVQTEVICIQHLDPILVYRTGIGYQNLNGSLQFYDSAAPKDSGLCIFDFEMSLTQWLNRLLIYLRKLIPITSQYRMIKYKYKQVHKYKQVQ